jgi:putative lipoic acid-binding regulatory protein
LTDQGQGDRDGSEGGGGKDRDRAQQAEEQRAQESRTLALLEANHAFPGDYPLMVIATNSEPVSAAIIGAIEEELATPLPPEARDSRLSSGSKYISHRLSVRCQAAADVVRLYARLRRVEGVVTVL